MTAGLVQHLGVPFGDVVSDKGEDLALTAAATRMAAGAAVWRRSAVRREVAAIVDERCARWGRWGVKVPRLVPLMGTLGDLFPNPRYVVVRRDTRAVARSIVQRRDASVPFAHAKAHAYRAMLSRIVAARRAPTFVLRYEEALARPRATVDRLAAFLGIDADEETRTRAAASIDPAGGYRPSRRVRGVIEEVTPRHVRGWVSDLLDDRASLPVEAVAHGARLAAGVADRSRQDVARQGHHATARCGFSLAFDRPLTPDEADGLVIHLPTLDHTLAFRLAPDGTIVHHAPPDGRTGAAAAGLAPFHSNDQEP